MKKVLVIVALWLLPHAAEAAGPRSCLTATHKGGLAFRPCDKVGGFVVRAARLPDDWQARRPRVPADMDAVVGALVGVFALSCAGVWVWARVTRPSLRLTRRQAREMLGRL